jgi:hypothetical protein
VLRTQGHDSIEVPVASGAIEETAATLRDFLGLAA